MAERPDWRPSWPEVPEGHEVVAIIDPDWEVLPEGSDTLCSRARWTHCGNRAVAALNRRHRRKGKMVDSWWRYCPQHMYGRWIEDGFVMHWILVKSP